MHVHGTGKKFAAKEAPRINLAGERKFASTRKQDALDFQSSSFITLFKVEDKNPFIPIQVYYFIQQRLVLKLLSPNEVLRQIPIAILCVFKQELTSFSSPLRPNMSAANRGASARNGRKRSREPDDDIPSSSAAPPSSRK